MCFREVGSYTDCPHTHNLGITPCDRCRRRGMLCTTLTADTVYLGSRCVSCKEELRLAEEAARAAAAAARRAQKERDAITKFQNTPLDEINRQWDEDRRQFDEELGSSKGKWTYGYHGTGYGGKQ